MNRLVCIRQRMHRIDNQSETERTEQTSVEARKGWLGWKSLGANCRRQTHWHIDMSNFINGISHCMAAKSLVPQQYISPCLMEWRLPAGGGPFLNPAGSLRHRCCRIPRIIEWEFAEWTSHWHDLHRMNSLLGTHSQIPMTPIDCQSRF
jgi:hypothetical protein